MKIEIDYNGSLAACKVDGKPFNECDVNEQVFSMDAFRTIIKDWNRDRSISNRRTPKTANFKSYVREDKNLPKFKVGDWVVFNGLTLYIKEIVKGYYITISKGGITNSYDWDIDNLARLWTIRDVTDGDVLAAGDWVCIFRNFHTNGFPKCHCHYDLTLEKFKVDTDSYMACGVDIYPATREQRDLLFAKMKESGYQWDADKKVLMKIKKINYKDMKQSEEYKMGYRDALTNIKNEIEQRIAETENVLEPLLTACNPIIGQRVASKQHNIKLGLAVAKIIIDKYYEDI